MGAISGLPHSLYNLHQTAWSAWARRRYRDEFQRVECFCLFAGYPRSGHSVVGAMLNAHRDAVISHELIASDLILRGCGRDELYSRILARAHWFAMRGNKSNYSYQIPDQWQGRFQNLRVIGDKRGGAVSRAIVEHPDFLERVRRLSGVPIKLIHIVRNPFDNIGAISVGHAMTLEQSAEYYFHHCRGTARLNELCGPGEVITAHHEAMIRDPRAFLSSLCAFLNLELYPGYLEDCCGVVFNRPTGTRRKVKWPAGLIAEIEKRAGGIPYLKDYGYEERELGA